MTRLLLAGAAVATGVGFWLNQPYGVIALALALGYAMFERSVAIGEKLVVAKEDATAAVVVLTNRLVEVEQAVSKYELAKSYAKIGR